MKKPAKKKLLKKMTKALHLLSTDNPSQRVNAKDGEHVQRVTTAPQVTTSTNPTNPRT